MYRAPGPHRNFTTAAISLAPAEARAAAAGAIAMTLSRAEAVLNETADAVAKGVEPAPLPPAPNLAERSLIASELGRIGRQIDVLHGAAIRLARQDAGEGDEAASQ